MKTIARRTALGLTLAAAAAPFAPRAQAQAPNLRFGIQPGLTYLPFAVMEHERLVQKHAASSGQPEPNVTFFRSAGGDILNDGLISGNLDLVATGIPSFLTLWSRGRGKLDVKILSSYGYSPIVLVTRDPDVHTLKDFTDRDRIALPAVGTSVQAIFLQMAAEKAFGPGQYARLDHITVSRSHPDAVAAVLGNTEINSHFTVPPYLAEYERANVGIHPITSAQEIVGEPVSNGVLYLTDRFHRANPGTIAVVHAALEEAIGIINKDPRQAAEYYLAVTHERSSIETILGILSSPGVHYDTVPRGVMTLARFMNRVHSIGAAPDHAEDLFFPEAGVPPGG
jgi:NitT/TauT family transport system substrate-binding protein